MIDTGTFLIHLTIFRVAMIGAGVVSMVLGYRLFSRGVWPEGGGGSDADCPGKAGGGGSEVGASVMGATFTVKNAAPGAILALFGMIIIVALALRHLPELKLREGDHRTTEVTIRGSGSSVEDLIMQGDEFFAEQKELQAIECYRAALGRMVGAMSRLAELYLRRGQVKEASSVAHLGARLDPVNRTFIKVRKLEEKEGVEE